MSFSLQIKLNGREKIMPIAPGRYIIGSRRGCGIVIEDPDLLAQHAMLLLSVEGRCDVRSLGGELYVDGEATRSASLSNGETLAMGNAVLRLAGKHGTHPLANDGRADEVKRPAAPQPTPSPPSEASASPRPGSRKKHSDGEHPLSRKKASGLPKRGGTGLIGPWEGLDETGLHRLLLARDEATALLEERLSRMRATYEDPEKHRSEVRRVIGMMLREHPPPPGVSSEALSRVLEDDILGLGVMEALLADPSITEIMVNHDKKDRENRIYVERGEGIELTPLRFRNSDHIRTIIERIVSPLNKRIDDASPRVDARLEDGSRVNAIIPPLAVDGPCITIRKFRKAFGVEALLARGAFSAQMLDFLRTCVESRLNIIVSGGTGSGKTTLLNALASFIPEKERIVTIEDTAELQLPQDHVVRLESRSASIEGTGAVPIRDLVINSLRMRPDRIVVGECRGGEALDMMQAMNTGHDGSLTTLHANSPRDALRRLEVTCLMADNAPPHEAIREQIVSAIHLVVQIQRFSRDNSRRIVKISEITGMQGSTPSLSDIFEFRQHGFDPTGVVLGEHVPTGTVPEFVKKWKESGIEVDMDMFRQAGTEK